MAGSDAVTKELVALISPQTRRKPNDHEKPSVLTTLSVSVVDLEVPRTEDSHALSMRTSPSFLLTEPPSLLVPLPFQEAAPTPFQETVMTRLSAPWES